MFKEKIYHLIQPSFVVVFSLSLLSTGCATQTNKIPQAAPTETSTTLESPEPTASPVVDSYKQDAQTLISYVEEIHPIFLLDEVPSDYEDEKQHYLEASKGNLSPEEFKLLTKKYLSSLKDAHTSCQFGKGHFFLDLDCTFIDDSLLVLDENNQPTHKKITEIGGLSIDDLLQASDTYFVAENETSRIHNYSSSLLGMSFLKCIGCDIHQNQVDVTFDENGSLSTEVIPFIDSETTVTTNTISSKWIDDIYYIDMNTCIFEGDEFDHEMKALKEAVNNGLHKVIIDVRDNGGGSADYCRTLINTLDMSFPTMGIFERYSLFTAQARGTLSSGTNKCTPTVATARQNPNIDLVVLTNDSTFSAATTLAAYVQDGKLGILIGTPSANSPSFYADIVPFELPYSGIQGQISSSKCYRADSNANQTTLQPDIVTEIGEDALNRAINYLKTK